MTRALVAIAVVWLSGRLLAVTEMVRGRRTALALLWIGDQSGRLARRLLRSR